jgi:hypothetical protein
MLDDREGHLACHCVASQQRRRSLVEMFTDRRDEIRSNSHDSDARSRTPILSPRSHPAAPARQHSHSRAVVLLLSDAVVAAVPVENRHSIRTDGSQADASGGQGAPRDSQRVRCNTGHGCLLRGLCLSSIGAPLNVVFAVSPLACTMEDHGGAQASFFVPSGHALSEPLLE